MRKIAARALTLSLLRDAMQRSSGARRNSIGRRPLSLTILINEQGDNESVLSAEKEPKAGEGLFVSRNSSVESTLSLFPPLPFLGALRPAVRTERAGAGSLPPHNTAIKSSAQQWAALPRPDRAVALSSEIHPSEIERKLSKLSGESGSSREGKNYAKEN